MSERCEQCGRLMSFESDMGADVWICWPCTRKEEPWLCSECGMNRADYPSDLCPGCEAYQEHQR